MSESYEAFLDQLSRVKAKRDALDRELAVCASAARAAGVPWAMIGAALGTTKQAAQQRFGR